MLASHPIVGRPDRLQGVHDNGRLGVSTTGLRSSRSQGSVIGKVLAVMVLVVILAGVGGFLVLGAFPPKATAVEITKPLTLPPAPGVTG
jgi:hypothetical protein